MAYNTLGSADGATSRYESGDSPYVHEVCDFNQTLPSCVVLSKFAIVYIPN